MIGQDKHKRSYAKPEAWYANSKNYEKKERKKRFEQVLAEHTFTFHEFKINNQDKDNLVLDIEDEMYSIWAYVGPIRTYWIYNSQGKSSQTEGTVTYTSKITSDYTLKGRTSLGEIVWIKYDHNEIKFYIK